MSNSQTLLLCQRLTVLTIQQKKRESHTVARSTNGGSGIAHLR